MNINDAKVVDDRFEKIVKHNGTKFQYEIAIEEMSECIKAIQKLKRGKGSLDQLIDEMADVMVTFGCLRKALEIEYNHWEPIEQSITRVILKKTDWITNCKTEGEPEQPVTHQDFIN